MTAYFALHNLSHDRKLAAALGDMVIAWAYAEETLIGVLSTVSGMRLNMTQEGYYRIPTFESRVRYIRALITEWDFDPAKKENLDTEIDKLSRLSSARNHWVHGDWCSDKQKTEVVIFDHRAPLGKRRKPVKSADIVNHNEAVLKRATTIRAFINWGALEP